ncbi:MAG: imidazole glycerol phosphate synthase subunit HisH [Fidelibacterota bacterium]
MIGIIDYGIGNIGSLTNAFRRLNISCLVSGNSKELNQCDQLVLPGVGAFRPAMNMLSTLRLGPFIYTWGMEGKPILGICLGMQLLFSESMENGLTSGLDIIPGTVSPLIGGKRKIHIGWNQVKPTQNYSRFQTPGYAYFVHSFICRPAEESHIIAETEYGSIFPSMVQKGNVIGVQFHPEKSQEFGMEILRRFSVEFI